MASHLVIGSESISPGGQLERHELAHIEQARHLGIAYLPVQSAAIVWSLAVSGTLDGDVLHANNAREVAANLAAGLPEDWNEETS